MNNLSNTKTIIVCNNKGGVGKSTCVAAIGDILARDYGKRVLLIDADPQGNLSKRFGYSPYDEVDNSYDLLLKARLDAKIQRTRQVVSPELFYNIGKLYNSGAERVPYNSLNIFCTTRELEKVYTEYRAAPEYSDGLIRNLLIEIRESEAFDYIIIDTQPVLSYILGQYMLGGDYVLIPVTPNDDALDGALAIGDVYQNAYEKKSEYKAYDQLELLGVFFNQVRKSTVIAKHFLPKLNEEWGDNPKLNTSIPFNQEVNNAEVENAPITAKSPSSAASVAFKELVRELVEKIG